jgi:hypothetical protein
MNQPDESSAARANIGKERLLQILKKLLDCQVDLRFLLRIEEKSLERLVAIVRARIEHER